jgi:hypothetical protein
LNKNYPFRSPKFPPMLSEEEFRRWLRLRHNSANLCDIAADLGVTHPAVIKWLEASRRPSRTVRILAARLLAEVKIEPDI